MDYRDFRNETPQVLRDFLTYHETIQGHSKATADEYFLDLRTFLRFIKTEHGLVSRTTPLDEISILDVGPELLRAITVTDVYAFMNYLSRERDLGPASRARKIAAIRRWHRAIR